MIVKSIYDTFEEVQTAAAFISLSENRILSGPAVMRYFNKKTSRG